MTKLLLRWMVWATCLFVSFGASAQTSKEYVLGSGDVIRVSVFQNPDLLVETRVSEAGTISFPLIGQVTVGGKSISDAEKTIADGLRNGKFINDPQVTILVLQIKGNQASILGYVNRPGRYPLEVAGMRLADLLALAGGATPDGSDTAVLTGTRDGKAFRREIDVPSLFGPSANDENNPVIRNNDIVYVGRAAIAYVYGEAQRPGPVRIQRDMNVRQALAAAGGPTLRGTERGLKLHRKDESGKTQILSASMDDLVRDGDVIYVRESLF